VTFSIVNCLSVGVSVVYDPARLARSLAITNLGISILKNNEVQPQPL